MFWTKRKKLKLVTHNGGFHADDVLATATLLIFYGGENIEVFRTRDKKVIESGDIVYDVGKIYDEGKNRFDHHQEDENLSRPNGIPYSSFGLIWKKYGQKLTGSKFSSDFIDRTVAQPVDALDNGLQIYKTIYPGLHPHTFNQIIKNFYNTWEEVPSKKNFNDAVDFAKYVLERIIKHAKALESARLIIEKVYKNSKDKRIIILDKQYPFDYILNQYEEPFYVVEPREEGGWNVKCIKIEPTNFEARKAFPENWPTDNIEELKKITGVKDVTFIHKARFLAVTNSREGAIELAKKSLEQQ